MILGRQNDPPPTEPVAETAPSPDDETIEKAREATFNYSDTLPNYLVQQITTRYSGQGKRNWQAEDIVTSDVTYEDGRESYKNIKVGGKATNKPMDQIEGTRSTGEFSTMLEFVLSSGVATFRRAGTDTIRNRTALMYTFEITRERSRWRIEAPSQLYYPAMRGRIWIDKESYRVLRLEQEGRGLPALFPFDTIESVADYDFVRLGTTRTYLLPVEAAVLSCQRGTSVCSRNVIEFRNYRRFGSDTNVTFGDDVQ